MNYVFENIDCVVCSANDIEKISNKGKFDLPTYVVLCKKCGLGYLNPRWNHESYRIFYKEQYDRYYRPKLFENLKVTEKSIVVERLEQYGLNFDKKSPNVLDIGSGAGGTIFSIRRKYSNFNYFSIEPSKMSQDILRKKGISILSDDVNSDWHIGSEKRFDIIIMRHVLEHFLNPVKVLEKVRNVLSQKGLIYIAVPDNLEHTRNLENNWFRNVHTYYFNKYSLANILDKVGLKMEVSIANDPKSRGEICLIVSRSQKSKSPSISSEHYVIQKNVFLSGLKQDRSLMNQFKTKLYGLKDKFL